MQRVVTAEMDLELGGSADLILQIATARSVRLAHEQLTVTQDGILLTPTEIVDSSGNRLHRLTGEAGHVRVRYDATVVGDAGPSPASVLDTITYLRPSRYCPSDALFGQARRRFDGLAGGELIAAVRDFVFTSTTYTPGVSQATDSAATTLDTGQGVCRDYAHLVIALLRAMDVPARYTACYAPGLRPMDFHAVAEACLDGVWYVLDATGLADRRSLVRIATGRDAADCSFLSSHGGFVGLQSLRVDATAVDGAERLDLSGEFAASQDDHAALVQMP